MKYEIRRRFLTLRSQTDQDIPPGRAVLQYFNFRYYTSGKLNTYVEEPWATSNSYQVQTGHRHRQREKRMLIGISIRSVTSKRSCALDDSPSCKRVESSDENEREKHLKL
jgi:hypothetical protein